MEEPKSAEAKLPGEGGPVERAVEDRPMRREERKVDDARAREILAKAEYGVLSMETAQGVYGVPLSFVVRDKAIYVHCALEGRKLDAIKKYPYVSFCAVASTQVLPQRFTTLYESAIAYGKVQLVTDEQERTRAFQGICNKYASDFSEEAAVYIQKSGIKAAILRLDIMHLSGKVNGA